MNCIFFLIVLFCADFKCCMLPRLIMKSGNLLNLIAKENHKYYTLVFFCKDHLQWNKLNKGKTKAFAKGRGSLPGIMMGAESTVGGGICHIKSLYSVCFKLQRSECFSILCFPKWATELSATFTLRELNSSLMQLKC